MENQNNRTQTQMDYAAKIKQRNANYRLKHLDKIREIEANYDNKHSEERKQKEAEANANQKTKIPV